MSCEFLPKNFLRLNDIRLLSDIRLNHPKYFLLRMTNGSLDRVSIDRLKPAIIASTFTPKFPAPISPDSSLS